ncbi:DinB family protein [Angustibacter peucedani]
MTNRPPWEPPFSAPAAVSLVAALDRQRTTFRWKADGLDRAGLDLTVGASSLSIGGLLKHLTRVEDVHFRWDVDGEAPSEPWRSHDWDADPDWDFTSAAHDEPAALYAAYDAAVAHSRQVLASWLERGDLEQPIAMGERAGVTVSLGRMVADMLEEYGRHTGQADVLRETVDGRVGEDPPADYLPPFFATA